MFITSFMKLVDVDVLEITLFVMAQDLIDEVVVADLFPIFVVVDVTQVVITGLLIFFLFLKNINGESKHALAIIKKL